MNVQTQYPVRPVLPDWDQKQGTYDHLFKPGFVHRDLYTSQDIFEAEMRHLYSRTWIYVAHESELPKTNDFVSRTMGRRPVVVTRTKSGEIKVLLNRCTHRGALVCRERRGNASRFTCGYHAWTFMNDGTCIGIPLKAAYGEDFDTGSRSLHVVPRVESYRGFVFACLDEAVVPLVEHLAGARPMLDDWLDRGDKNELIVRNGSMQFNTQANWKTIYDNAGDGYHPPFSHVSMLRVFGARYGDVDMNYWRADFDQSPLVIYDLGNGHTMLDQRPAMHAESAWKRQHVSPGREEIWKQLSDQLGEERALFLLDASTGGGMNINIFPNLLIIGNQIQVVEPIARNQTVIHWYSTSLDGAPDEINATRMRLQEDFPSFGEVDDNAQFEACQAGMENVPELEWIDISRHLSTDLGSASAEGLWSEPASSDRHMRTYFTAWRSIMNNAVEATQKA